MVKIWGRSHADWGFILQIQVNKHMRWSMDEFQRKTLLLENYGKNTLNRLLLLSEIMKSFSKFERKEKEVLFFNPIPKAQLGS